MTNKQLSEDKTKSANLARRRFTKSGIAASGVILTLASRPVLANFGECKSPSGFMSANLSSHNDPMLCFGRSPGYWANHPKEWLGFNPGTYVNDPTKKSQSTNELDKWKGGTPFSDAFGGSRYFEEYSMMQVLWMNGGQDPFQIGAHHVAALLNATAGTTPPLTPMQVVDMFLDWEVNGFYEPTAGIQWNGSDIVYYIQSTFS